MTQPKKNFKYQKENICHTATVRDNVKTKLVFTNLTQLTLSRSVLGKIQTFQTVYELNKQSFPSPFTIDSSVSFQS